jgi:hypothetical protein
VKYNVDLLNQYRATQGLPPLLYDAKISDFALDGSKQLFDDHTAHAHFAKGTANVPGFGTHVAENQGDPSGVPKLAADPVANEKQQIATLLKIMFDEGPGEGEEHGHYMNMMSPKYRRVGVGLFYASDGKFYLTNDLSD